MTENVLDTDVLGELTGMGLDELHELVEMYLAQADDTLAGLRAAIAADAVGDVARLAHKLAGSSAACGASAMQHALRGLEQRAKSNQLTAADRSLNDVLELLELSRIGFARYTRTSRG